MKFRLFMLLLLLAALPLTAQTVRLTGVVVDASTGAPIPGAKIQLRDQSGSALSGKAGDFLITGLKPGLDYITIMVDGHQVAGMPVSILDDGSDIRLGDIRLKKANGDTEEFFEDFSDMIFDEGMLEDEEGNTQNVAALTGANDNLYYSTASYNFGPMYFRYRGLDSRYQAVYINGIKFNDLLRGRFNFSSLLGMTSRAFRNKTTTVGLDASTYGFGDIAGSVNYNTVTDTYAPGFQGAVAYTNSNYMLRAMATYSTGMRDNGWAFTISAIGRYAKEGVIDGTFYNSAGLFMSLEKRLNQFNSLTLTAFGGPTQRATASATYQEAYDLAGSNLYNPNWGYYQGKKRASRITETFDPTVILNWLHRKGNTTINTAASVRWVNYTQAALQYYKANDPNPTYYRYLPSYYADNEELYDLYKYNWEHNEYTRQVKWDELYYINELNNVQNQTLSDADKKGSSYIMENRVSNQFNAMFNSYINQRLNPNVTLQAGIGFNYTDGKFYKTVRDLMGGEFWLDVDPFSDRDITIAPDNLQNDLDHPNRRVGKGDRFGYDYNIEAIRAEGFIQNIINLPHWDINYGMQMSFTQYQRTGHMRNGRAPYNSLGKGATHRFDDASVKVGVIYKINGRNNFSAHLDYGTNAPIPDQIYVSPRIQDKVAPDLKSERIFSGDVSYNWNFRRFRGSITGFIVDVDNATERFGFYDEQYNTYTNFVLSDVKRVNKGVELGMAYKITPSLTASFAGTYSKYQYKNNPLGTRSFENGLYADTTQVVYLKNYYAGSVPQTVMNLGIDWAAPHSWFFNVNGTWQGDAYVNLSPAYHEALPGLWDSLDAPTPELLHEKIAELATQDKLKDAFSLNVSIGKLVYINRKVSLNFNLNINNVLNNKDVVTYAYQQGRLDTSTYIRNKYPNRYTYAQGTRVFFNVGVKF